MKTAKKVLLIVDDRPENLDLLISFLEKCDFNIIVAISGEETFKRLEYVKPDILLLDIMMPGIDGFETCRRLKKDDRYNDIPVIFMSALSDTVDKVKGLEFGAVDYISKPFMPEEVLARINTHLQIQDLRKKLSASNRTLEERVVERTVELEGTNRKLREEITERERIEHDLKLFKELINQSHDALYVSDVETGRILDVNNSACVNLGYTRDELLGLSIIDIEEVFKNKSDWDKMMQKVDGHAEDALEGKHVRKDGTSYPVEVSGKNIKINGKEFNVSVARDITKRKRAEAKLRKLSLDIEQANANLEERVAERTRELEETQNIARLGHWNLDLKSNNLTWSKEVFNIFEIDPEKFDASYDTFLNAIHPDDKEKVNAAYRLSLKGRQPYEIIHRLLMKDGRVKYVQEMCRTEYDDDGTALCSVGAVQDITELKEVEDQLKEANQRLKEIDQLKTMFIASMSHELRTPLNSIIGFTGMTLMGLSGELNQEQSDNIQRAHKASKHLLSLISDIIDISKIEAGVIEVYCEPFYLHEITEEAIHNIQHLLKGKNISLEVNVSEGIDLNTDRKRFLQCLVNLLTNAAKYTDTGKIVISSKKVGKNIEFSVADTGIGISENDLPKLFMAFERINTHMTVNAGGTGLGLYLTKRIVTEFLCGTITVESKEGVGSVFRLRVPMVLNSEKNC